jgi:hypothetical protein
MEPFSQHIRHCKAIADSSAFSIVAAETPWQR